ncbi:uncharacterized protein EDB91DRAFT_1080941 [Suillus paluster]|uniref:uncharacterized protein n=1 Tax=Suillus paluster TaxID=48578 RepID=UPI001B866E25|nr:uncharacterized protein EDB91DRAFT_1080941 [Suillus paluster]KAG1744149.1 hypothetical protein EDB91DRAFT_1080941 [Suillus paluster]
MAAISSFRQKLWPRHCLASARELDIYNLAVKQTGIQPVSDESPQYNVPKKEHPTIVRGCMRQPSTRPPHPEHSVRSLQTTTPTPPPKPSPAPTLSKSELLGLPRLTAADVGVGEDWSHLNKRRQRARKEKVERDLKWMWTLQAAKREAAREALAAQRTNFIYCTPTPFLKQHKVFIMILTNWWMAKMRANTAHPQAKPVGEIDAKSETGQREYNLR